MPDGEDVDMNGGGGEGVASPAKEPGSAKRKMSESEASVRSTRSALQRSSFLPLFQKFISYSFFFVVE